MAHPAKEYMMTALNKQTAQHPVVADGLWLEARMQLLATCEHCKA
jgi:hypothetical protein